MLPKIHRAMIERYFVFCLWLSEKWLWGALGKLLN